jgi:hypothetical protein
LRKHKWKVGIVSNIESSVNFWKIKITSDMKIGINRKIPYIMASFDFSEFTTLKSFALTSNWKQNLYSA